MDFQKWLWVVYFQQLWIVDCIQRPCVIVQLNNDIRVLEGGRRGKIVLHLIPIWIFGGHVVIWDGSQLKNIPNSDQPPLTNSPTSSAGFLDFLGSFAMTSIAPSVYVLSTFPSGFTPATRWLQRIKNRWKSNHLQVTFNLLEFPVAKPCKPCKSAHLIIVRHSDWEPTFLTDWSSPLLSLYVWPIRTLQIACSIDSRSCCWWSCCKNLHHLKNTH